MRSNFHIINNILSKYIQSHPRMPFLEVYFTVQIVFYRFRDGSLINW